MSGGCCGERCWRRISWAAADEIATRSATAAFSDRLGRAADRIKLVYCLSCTIELLSHEAARTIRSIFYTVPFSYYQIDPIKESLINAGFTDINVTVVGLEKEIPDAARFARGLIHGNPLIDEIRGRGGVDPDQIVDALAQALSQEFGPDRRRMPLQAIIFSASRR